MESFEGLFIASTNLMDRFDYASLRRLDQKIRFGYLKPAQSEALFRQVLKEHGLPCSTVDQFLIDKVAGLSNLTPGDFAAVIRRARLRSDNSEVRWWTQALEKECGAKPDRHRRTIGFVS